jgi:hypothetical protein
MSGAAQFFQPDVCPAGIGPVSESKVLGSDTSPFYGARASRTAYTLDIDNLAGVCHL